MTITSEDLTGISEIFTATKKASEEAGSEVEIDLQKAVRAMIETGVEFATGEGDVADKITAALAKAGDMADLLENATEHADGRITAKVSEDDVKKVFGEQASTPSTTEESITPGSEDEDVEKVAKAFDLLPLTTDSDSADLDDGEWPEDFAPAEAPLRKSDRTVRSNQVVMARPGVMKEVRKSYEGRKRALSPVTEDE